MKKRKQSLYQLILKVKKAGLSPYNVLDGDATDILLPVSERIEKLRTMLTKSKLRKPGNAMFFIMYDIENNKIRRLIAKYLIRHGCVRIQKSVYFADIKRQLFVEIQQTLMQINEMYDNDDSIFFIPVSDDHLNNLRVIGRNLDFEYMTTHVSTMFI
jgi:CRISPR-associated endonuclease Cas2